MNNKIKKKVVSAMRPTGRLHIGNYHSVIKNWIKLQKNNECFFFIADMHALTTHYDKIEEIKKNIKPLIIDWIASGINPKKCKIFLQSDIPEISELHLILSMITPISWLERVPSYKEKNAINKCNYGYLGYPILQGSDLIIFESDLVPIGEDQIPHIELIREIIRKINKIIKNHNPNNELIKEPIPILNENKKIIGIDGKKMSKSNDNAILISDDISILEKKVNKIMTDPLRINKNIKGNPNNCNVWNFHKIYSKKENIYLKKSCEEANIGCVDCKKILLNNIIKEHIPILKKIKEIEKNDKIIDNILKHNIKKVKKLAKKNLDKFKKLMGFK